MLMVHEDDDVDANGFEMRIECIRGCGGDVHDHDDGPRLRALVGFHLCD